MIFITKGGLSQQVSEAAFEQLFEPNGWEIDTKREQTVDEVQQTAKGFRNQSDTRNYLRMARADSPAFDDNIFKSGG